MASELPVVATNVGGNPNVVIDGETGFLVPLGQEGQFSEAVVNILQHKDLAKQMGTAGLRRVQELFSLDKMVANYERVCDELLTKRGIV